MTIDFENESNIDLGLDCYAIAEEVISASLDYMNCPYEAQVNLLITNNEEIHQINLEQREVDCPTDVLSFPMYELEPGEHPDEMDADPETGLIPLGDMVISLERAEEQAKEFGHSVEREVCYLTVHSVLHLLGYDHMDEGPMKAQMREREEAILGTLGITREKS